MQNSREKLSKLSEIRELFLFFITFTKITGHRMSSNFTQAPDLQHMKYQKL